jgi:hypothetical protein
MLRCHENAYIMPTRLSAKATEQLAPNYNLLISLVGLPGVEPGTNGL